MATPKEQLYEMIEKLSPREILLVKKYIESLEKKEFENAIDFAIDKYDEAFKGLQDR